MNAAPASTVNGDVLGCGAVTCVEDVDFHVVSRHCEERNCSWRRSNPSHNDVGDCFAKPALTGGAKGERLAMTDTLREK